MKNKKGKKGAKDKDDQVDLVNLVDDLKNDLHWKDVELQEMKEELEMLRAANKQLKTELVNEKHQK